jgi:hypothetical protein
MNFGTSIANCGVTGQAAGNARTAPASDHQRAGRQKILQARYNFSSRGTLGSLSKAK